jgi:hypothetical protein
MWKVEYKKRLVAKIVEKEEHEQQQREYRKKYKIEEEGIINVVKKRYIEIFLYRLDKLVKMILWILHIILSAIGVISLLYPETRLFLYSLGMEWINQGMDLIKR